MKTNRHEYARMRVVILVSLFLTAACLSDAQHNVRDTVGDVLRAMKSSKWKERKVALEKAVSILSGEANAQDTGQIRVGIIQLLIKENNGGLKEPDNQAPLADGEGYGEEKAEYYAGLIDLVASFNDERAIPALLGAASSGGMAIRAVADFGKKALDMTLTQATSTDPDLASGALHVIREMLAVHSITDPDSNIRIKNTLRLSLNSPEHRVRENAIGTIEYLPDRNEFVTPLEQIAEHDPYKFPGKPSNGGAVTDLYIVRTRAQLLLRKISNHEAIPAR